MLEKIIGKKSHQLSADDLRELVAGYSRVVIDFGCGDGMLPYRLAQQNPDVFYIGIDAARESLAVASAKAAKKPSRGGCANALFLCSNVLDDMPDLHGIADEIQWNFPWGSLMRALVASDEIAIKNMVAASKKEADFIFYLNLYVFENDNQRTDMGLPDINTEFVEKTLCPAWAKLGIVVEETSFLPPDELKDHPSTWAGRLIRRSGRNTLMMTGKINHG